MWEKLGKLDNFLYLYVVLTQAGELESWVVRCCGLDKLGTKV